MTSKCQTMAILALCLAFAVSPGVSGRALQQAAAPAPMMAMGTADGVMTLSAAQALFMKNSSLVLSGLPNTTQYIKYPPMPKAGAVIQDTLVGPSFAGDGNKWLSSPQATLIGTYNGNMSTALVQLDAPRTDSKLNTMTFTYKLLTALTLVAMNGTANTVAMDQSNTMQLLSSVNPSTLFYNVTLAIDVVGIDKYISPQAGEKAGLIEVPLGWSGFYYPG